MQPAPSATAPRLDSIDALRGLVMIIMALDHVRDYFSNATVAPLDLSSTTPALFMTRWITHLCAPAFVLLAGTSAYLWGRDKTKAELSRFLLTRGLWLILLELTVVRFAWFFTLDYHILMLQVIWALGWSMVILAGLVWLPRWAILAIAVALIGGHNLLDMSTIGGALRQGGVWNILHQRGMLEPVPGYQVYVLYPLIPWMGVMGLGYVLGSVYDRPQPDRRKWLIGIGVGLVLAFIAIRALNVYGDPTKWFAQDDTLFTILSFINTEKYPPSLLFLLMTLGPALILLAAFDRPIGGAAKPLIQFGRVPLFFYIIHLYAIHLLAVVVALIQYGRADWLFGGDWFFHLDFPQGYGYDLPWVYLIWLVIVAILYPAVVWFGRLKREKSSWLLKYL